jgi:hypothetical protein
VLSCTAVVMGRILLWRAVQSVVHPATPVESVLWSVVTGQPHPVPPLALFIRLQPVTDGIVHRFPSVWDTHAGRPVREIKE